MISIFIPVYNGEKYLSKTLDSILNQTYKDFEVLCVNDSSSDESLIILEDYSRQDNRIKVFTKPNGGDAPHSWNYVIPLINGDFTMYMSQDDLLEPDVLDKLYKRQLETNADAVIPTTVFYEEDKSYEEVRVTKGINGDTSRVISGKEAFSLMLDYEIGGFAIWRTDIVKRIGMRMEAFNDDEVAQREWASHCNRVAFSEANFLFRRDNVNCITRQWSPKQFSVVWSNARLLELMIENDIDDQTILEYRNKYYESLWWYTMHTLINKRHIEDEQYEYLMRLYTKSYKIIHKGVTLNKWYYKYSSKSLVLFWGIICYKYLKSKLKSC